jgi:hypothetical protein
VSKTDASAGAIEVLQGLPLAYKIIGAVVIIAGGGAALYAGANGVLDAPSDIEALTSRVTALDSTFNHRLDLVDGRLETVADTAAESLRVARETRCIILGHAAGKTFEEIMQECLQ